MAESMMDRVLAQATEAGEYAAVMATIREFLERRPAGRADKLVFPLVTGARVETAVVRLKTWMSPDGTPYVVAVDDESDVILLGVEIRQEVETTH